VEALHAADVRAQALEVAHEPQRLEATKLNSRPVQGSSGQFEELAAETKRLLSAALQSLDSWQAKAARVGQRLAELAGRAV
jgi:hypothetical protein